MSTNIFFIPNLCQLFFGRLLCQLFFLYLELSVFWNPILAILLQTLKNIELIPQQPVHKSGNIEYMSRESPWSSSQQENLLYCTVYPVNPAKPGRWNTRGCLAMSRSTECTAVNWAFITLLRGWEHDNGHLINLQNALHL